MNFVIPGTERTRDDLLFKIAVNDGDDLYSIV
jgi:hypothetical protein